MSFHTVSEKLKIVTKSLSSIIIIMYRFTKKVSPEEHPRRPCFLYSMYFCI